jgi:hypothetical protein
MKDIDDKKQKKICMLTITPLPLYFGLSRRGDFILLEYIRKISELVLFLLSNIQVSILETMG